MKNEHKPTQHFVTDSRIAQAIDNRIDWIITSHNKLLQKQQNTLKNHQPSQQLPPFRLWGKVQDIELDEAQRLDYYRAELQSVMPQLFAKWQPIVGKSANEMRIKKMTTRWGSCNTRAKRIWLSVYLPEYPLECTEYVIVHELCHLHHADHSAKFWAEVKRAMPDYQYWYDILKGKTNIDDY